jgi:DNA-binding CsgD family transcriptional regulator
MLLKSYFDLSQSPDLGSFQRQLVTMAESLGFPLVSATLVVEGPSPVATPKFHAVSNTPQAFIASAYDVNAGTRDPMNRHVKRSSVPIVYDQKLYVEEGAGDLWEEQAPYGYKHGVAVALHLPNHQRFVLGVDRDTPLPEDDGRLGRLMGDLQLMSVHAQAAAVRLLLPAEGPASPRLTPRELDILRWSAEGKSAWNVGEILGVSEHTVNFHMRNIFKKLDCSSKQQALLKAMQLGLI